MSTETRFYNPNRHADWNYGGSKWKLSRSKIDLFLECPRCFYLDNKLGTKRPNFPPFNLNLAVDELFKKEFDLYREKQLPHPLMHEHGIAAIPFQHEKLSLWRDNFEGITYRDELTDLLVSGAVDDIWIHTTSHQLIVVDYKATSKEGSIISLSDSSWDEQYLRQLSVYGWLLSKNGFSVSDTAYIIYANAQKSAEKFNNVLTFEITVLPCKTNTDWIQSTLTSIRTCLDATTIPEQGNTCEYCPYREATGKKFIVLHRKEQARNKQ